MHGKYSAKAQEEEMRRRAEEHADRYDYYIMQVGGVRIEPPVRRVDNNKYLTKRK